MTRFFYKEVNLYLKDILRSFPWRTKSLFSIDLANINFARSKIVRLSSNVSQKVITGHRPCFWHTVPPGGVSITQAFQASPK